MKPMVRGDSYEARAPAEGGRWGLWWADGLTGWTVVCEGRFSKGDIGWGCGLESRKGKSD